MKTLQTSNGLTHVKTIPASLLGKRFVFHQDELVVDGTIIPLFMDLEFMRNDFNPAIKLDSEGYVFDDIKKYQTHCNTPRITRFQDPLRVRQMLAYLLSLQPHGEDGELLSDGMLNIFPFIKSPSHPRPKVNLVVLFWGATTKRWQLSCVSNQHIKKHYYLFE